MTVPHRTPPVSDSRVRFRVLKKSIDSAHFIGKARIFLLVDSRTLLLLFSRKKKKNSKKNGFILSADSKCYLFC